MLGLQRFEAGYGLLNGFTAQPSQLELEIHHAPHSALLARPVGNMLLMALAPLRVTTGGRRPGMAEQGGGDGPGKCGRPSVVAAQTERGLLAMAGRGFEPPLPGAVKIGGVDGGSLEGGKKRPAECLPGQQQVDRSLREYELKGAIKCGPRDNQPQQMISGSVPERNIVRTSLEPAQEANMPPAVCSGKMAEFGAAHFDRSRKTEYGIAKNNFVILQSRENAIQRTFLRVTGEHIAEQGGSPFGEKGVHHGRLLSERRRLGEGEEQLPLCAGQGIQVSPAGAAFGYQQRIAGFQLLDESGPDFDVKSHSDSERQSVPGALWYSLVDFSAVLAIPVRF